MSNELLLAAVIIMLTVGVITAITATAYTITQLIHYIVETIKRKLKHG